MRKLFLHPGAGQETRPRTAWLFQEGARRILARYLGGIGGVGLVEEGPYLGFGLLPPAQVAGIVGLFEAELAGELLVARLVCVQV